MTVISSVDVVTQACQGDLDTIANADALGLPRFSGDEGDAQNLNIMAQQLEAIINEKALQGAECVICPTNGAVILDCQECGDFRIMATTDINSITMLNCDGGDGVVDVYIPPNVTRCICGWPERFGFEGGECVDNCVSGGTNPAGRVFQIPYSGSPAGPQIRGLPGGGVPTTGGGGGGGGGGGCSCTPTGTPPSELTIACCTTNCAFDCTATTPSLSLRACGGLEPYIWSTTYGLLDTTEGDAVVLTKPSNPGSAGAGTAFASYYCSRQPAACLVEGTLIFTGACDDTTTCAAQFAGTCCPGITMCDGNFATCTDLTLVCDDCGGAITVGGGTMADCRSQAMIDAGCEPCYLMKGAVVTVIDATGVSASKTITMS